MIAASAMFSLVLLCAVMFWAVFSAVLFIMRDRDRHPLMTVEMAVDLTHDAMDRVFVAAVNAITGTRCAVSTVSARTVRRMKQKAK